jgi:hypothetical protein
MADTKSSIADVPATIRHLRPRGRDVIHVVVGGEMPDGSIWIPSQEEMETIVDDWRRLLPARNIVVTSYLHEATAEPEGTTTTKGSP